MNLNEDQSRRIRELEAELRQSQAVVEYFQNKLETARNEHTKEKVGLMEEISKGREHHTQELQMIKVSTLRSLHRRAPLTGVSVSVFGSSGLLFD